MDSLKDKRCFVTGAASGIGRAVALGLAKEGAILFLTDVDGPGLERTAREVEAAGGRVAARRPLDVSDFDAVRTFASDLHREFGSMDVVMNVAGISIWGPVESMEHRHWRRIMDVNLMGPIHVIESFVPEMIRARRGGHLVNVSSAAGLFGLPWHAAYSGSKFGLRGISEVLRFDLERHGIGVSLVCPGGVDTGLVNTIQILGTDVPPERMNALKQEFRDRAVSPETAARAIIRGVLRNRYLVFTSRDTRIGHFFQQKLSFVYELTMRKLNDRLHRTLVPAARTDDAGRLAETGAT
ncbi:MAG TPA: SDR family oxidoreductase [Polyangiaceae bacterium]|nr:SDR family oxidoreductase [Polyangiaceae bacterium]